MEEKPTGEKAPESPNSKDTKDTKPPKTPPPPKASAVPVFRLWRFASSFDLLLITIGLIFSAGVGALFPSFFLVLGDLLGKFSAAPPGPLPPGFDIVAEVVPTVLSIVYIGIAQWVAGYICQCFWVLSGENQTKRIRMLYVQSILRQNIGWFDEAQDGSLTSRLAQDTQIIQDGISEKAGMAVQCIAQFTTGFIIAFVKGWQLALVMLAALPLLGLVGSMMFWSLTKLVGIEQNAYADAGTVAEQVFSGLRTVYSFSLQSRFQKRYETEIEKAYRSEVFKGVVMGAGVGGFFLVLFCTYGLAFWYGSRLVISDVMKGQDVMTVFFAMMLGAMAIITLPPNIAAISSARGAAYKIFAIIDRIPAIDSHSPEGLKPESMVGEVEFNNVSFHYPTRPDVPILRNLNLKIQKGTTVAFVGPSGSGKSTSISLIQRFYDAISGTVAIDGIDVKSLNVKWLRQHIGVVSQEPVLFNTTIKQNILMGASGDVTENDFIECCKQANCHNFISALPKGYDTLVGEHGGMLSGGQKQRIAIARALIGDPKLLLLDEATSALDTTSERIVQAALDKISSTRTTIVVAHRLSTIRNADVIVVMSNGVPIERGNHDELVALGGVYKDLVEKQKIKMTEGGDKPEKEVDAGTLDEMEITALRAGVDLSVTKLNVDGTIDKSSAQTTNLHSVQAVGIAGVPETRLRLDDAFAVAKAETKRRKQLKDENKARGQKSSSKGTTLRVIKMMKPEWHNLLIGSVGAMIAGCVFPVFGYTLGTVVTLLLNPVKEDISPGPFQGANLYAFLFVVIGVCMLLGTSTQFYFFARAGAQLTRRLRCQVFAALLSQEVGFFDHPDNSVGAITARLATEAAAVSDMITKVWGDVIQLIFTAAAGLFIGFYHAWNLTLVVLLIVPFMAAASMYQSKIHRGFEDKTKKAYEQSVEVAAEAIKEIRTVAGLTREEYFQEKYAAAIAHPHVLAERKAYVASIGHAAHQGFQMFGNALGFYAGVRFIAAGTLEFSNLFVVIMAITITAQGLGRASTFTSHLTKGKLAAINTFEILDRKTQIDPNAPGETPLHLTGEFDFKDVAFTYPARPDQPIFTGGFNLHGKPNQTIALVGPSGCGKSTTIGMLERWYDRESGSVTVDGKDVKSYQLKDGLRRHMALVGQEPILFDMSIRENILWGTNREGVQDEEVEEAAKMANIHNFVVSLPQGYETRVGAGGSQLSGGQKQRVAIARALIRKPQILLLDEATSALDSESEKLVQEAIDRAISDKKRTTITIAHRLSTIQNADLIAVVKDGKVVESGSHFELLALEGVYTGLVKEQDLNVLH